MFTRRSATIAACAACWIGVATHSVAEPAPYQAVRSLLLGAGLISLILLTYARRRRQKVSPITADILNAFGAHATRTRDRISGQWSAPVIPLPCEPTPAHRWLAPAGATVLVTAVVGGLVVLGWDGPDQPRAARPPRPPAAGPPPPGESPTQPPASPSPTKRDGDESPTTGRETGEATTPSPQPRPDAPTAGTSSRSARDGGGEPATSPTRSTGSTGSAGSTGTSPASPSDAPTTTAGGSEAEPKPTRTPIRRVIRRVAP